MWFWLLGGLVGIGLLAFLAAPFLREDPEQPVARRAPHATPTAPPSNPDTVGHAWDGGQIAPAKPAVGDGLGAREMFPGLPDSHQLTPAPTVEWHGSYIPLRDWLRHGAGENAWSEVVSNFYDRAAEDPEVASYFRAVDMLTLQRHFMAALMLATGQGISVGVVRGLRDAHSRVLNERGEPINERIWDKVVATLAGVLRDHRVPQSAIGDLAATLGPIKGAIVRA